MGHFCMLSRHRASSARVDSIELACHITHNDSLPQNDPNTASDIDGGLELIKEGSVLGVLSHATRHRRKRLSFATAVVVI